MSSKKLTIEVSGVDELKRITDNLATGEDKFAVAPEVQEVANRLISNEGHFGHLAEARISYLFRRGPWLSKGSIVMGRAYVMDERQRFLTGLDLQVIVNLEVWKQANKTQREAIVAHELCHFEPLDFDKDGNPRWRMTNHDLEEFAYVVRRYGIWDESLRRFMAAKQEGEIERAQVKIFPDDDERDAS